MRKILFAAIALAVLASCSEKPSKHVVLIGIDGMSSTCVDSADIPNIRSLMDAGSWTLKKRSVFPTSSAINWASMFMAVGTELHGYTTWGSRVPELPSRVVNEHGISPTVFSELKRQIPSSEVGCIAEWDNIPYNLVDSAAVDYYAVATEYLQDNMQLCNMAVSYIKEKQPSLFAICYDQVDHAGHVSGWDGPEYMATLHEIDRQVGLIVEAVKESGMYENTVFVVTSDHGGIGNGHGGITLNEVETPFIIAGKGISSKGEFDDSMMQFDVAATVACVFDLEQPQVWTGRPVAPVFE